MVKSKRVDRLIISIFIILLVFSTNVYMKEELYGSAYVVIVVGLFSGYWIFFRSPELFRRPVEEKSLSTKLVEWIVLLFGLLWLLVL